MQPCTHLAGRSSFRRQALGAFSLRMLVRGFQGQGGGAFTVWHACWFPCVQISSVADKQTPGRCSWRAPAASQAPVSFWSSSPQASQSAQELTSRSLHSDLASWLLSTG